MIDLSTTADLSSFAARLSPTVWACLEPPAKVSSWEWIQENFREPVEGKPFDAHAFPWTKGICEAWDDPRTKEIWMQFAARVGKSTIALALILCGTAIAPAPFLFGSSTEALAKQTTKTKVWRAFDRCDITRDWCPAEHYRTQNRVELAYATGYVAWSGSPTTLSDIGPRRSWANEIDKWTNDKSAEGDPLDLFKERGIEIPGRKLIGECTPTIENASRINAELKSGTNERFHVPCPKCGAFQKLGLGDGSPGSGGIIWDKEPDGGSSPDRAGTTARYQCATCKKEFGDEYKRGMNNRGVWVPEGCLAGPKGELVGRSVRSPRSRSFQLSRLYAPTFTFGDVAHEFVSAVREVKAKRPKRMQNFVNSWAGDVWREHQQSRKWEDVAKRLCIEKDRKETQVPEEAIFLTAGVDRQIDKLVYWVAAWGERQRGWLVEVGQAESWLELLATLDTSYMRKGSPKEMQIGLALIDSRYGQDEVDEFCRKWSTPGRLLWPYQGAKPGQLQGHAFRLAMEDKEQEKKRLKGRAHVKIVTGNTSYFQGVVDRCLFKLEPGDDGFFSFPDECADDADLWEQLLNEIKDETKVPEQWVKVSTSIPVDLRDGFRMARTAAEIHVRRSWKRVRRKAGTPKRRPTTGVISTVGDSQLLSRPQGWIS